MARILVVEDDGALRSDIACTVTEWGHEVFVASDGMQGFESINELQPDLVLCDVNMPEENGVDLVGRIAKAGIRYSDMPFIFVSSLSGAGFIASGIQCGADDYVTKPIDFALLKAKVTAHLRKRDRLIAKCANEQLAATLADNVFTAGMFVAAVAALGLAALLIIYWIKTVLGINIFVDFHLSDVF